MNSTQQIMPIDCMGERYIACGKGKSTVSLVGTPGNDLGAYLDGADIILHGNAQDATGNTMNDGTITICGGTGDTAGYAMRGGAIYIRDNAGYRTGIHMKEYKDKRPVIVIGGHCGSFLGEYQAGGLIIVLGIGMNGATPVGGFCGTGMHGGKIFLRSDKLPEDLPEQVLAHKADADDMALIEPYVTTFAEKFGYKEDELLSGNFFVLVPNTKNPYKQLYVNN